MTGLHPSAIAQASPNREALVFGAQRWTYAQLDDFSANVAALLAQDGLANGEVVALLVANRPEFLGAAWAAQRSGLYYLPLSTRLTAPEIRYILADSGAKALIVDSEYEDLAKKAISGLPLKVYGLGSEIGFEPLESAFSDYPAPPAIEGGDMLYTSGTTGKPKGVRRALTGEALGSDARRVARGEKLFGFSPDTRFLSPAPLYHAAPLRFSMNLLRVGACVIGMPRFDAAGTLNLIESERITHSQWVPTMFARLLALETTVQSQYELSSLEVAIHAGAPCPEHIKRQMIDWWGPVLHEYYSGTESVGFTHITSNEWLERPGSVGRPYGCKIHIVGDGGLEQPTGQDGLVYFEGKGGLTYHNDAAKTAAAHDARGWATMGDIGHLDADGYLYLTDRKHFTIITGGVNIYPSEIEAALMDDDAVGDCAVFGVPDAEMGEAVAAIIESDRAGDAYDEALALSIIERLDGKLARTKCPRFILFQSVDRTETGKLKKQDLREGFLREAHPLDMRALRKAAQLENTRAR